MLNKNLDWKDYFFSHITIAYAIGVIGVISSVTTVFLDTSTELSIKYFLFIIFLFLTIFILLIKIIKDLINSKNENKLSSGAPPVSYSEANKTFLFKKQPFYSKSVVYFIYVEESLAERLAYIVVPYYEQETVVQLQVLKDFKIFDTPPKEAETLSKLVVKDQLSVTLLNEISFDNE
ncbi:hypothetical protein NRB11_18585 [Acinetobacter baumannii]|uniref:hypothetical protein n=1 Tax=Acinetobacter TaxID=469 RepID=UPI00019AE194|nr:MULTISPECIES: hypothetical protein [Acinetobacter]EEH68378.1 hypothetical protein HMPREF0023_2076 [Acinetobacter sp. ATCC 27244]MDC5576479.1 hypothetical protein [Acinetobacter baumannii]